MDDWEYDAALLDREPVSLYDMVAGRVNDPAVPQLRADMSTRQRFDAIRRIYVAEAKYIARGEYSPYIANWEAIFTPIEREMWDAIRCYGGLRFYPQYPVGRYFVDFGDPWKCIAIECDGKRWHDEAKDAARDKALESLGWIVLRIPGSACLLRSESRDLAFQLLENTFGSYRGRYPDYSEDPGE